jgi:hypothetical protein
MQRAGESWGFRSDRFGEVIARPDDKLPGVPGYASEGNIRVFFIPVWSAILVAAPLAAAPWIRQLRYRFSLRTLLLATTLVAVVLGLIVWLR